MEIDNKNNQINQLHNNILNGLTMILSNISDKNEKNTCIYVSVGSAAYSANKNEITGIWSIDDQNNQQFPQFLKSLKQILPFSPVHIILIDPMLENPPLIVWDKSTDNTKCSNNWKKTNIYQKFDIEHYENNVNNINVYVLRKYVIYEPYDNRFSEIEAINISLFLIQLDVESIENNWFTVFNDFSGVIMSNIALVHDKTLKDINYNHLNHVIYGLGTRKDGGCNFDLTLPECDFVYDITSNGIKVFNPFYNTCHDNDILKSLMYLAEMPDATEKHKRDCLIVMSQIEELIKYKRKIILYEIMTLVRQFGKLLKDPSQIDKKSIRVNNLYILFTYKINLEELYKNEKYFDIFYHCVEILKKELKEHICVIYKQETNDIVEKIVLDMILMLDPYSWYNQISQLLKEFDKRTGKEIKIEY